MSSFGFFVGEFDPIQCISSSVGHREFTVGLMYKILLFSPNGSDFDNIKK